MWVFKSLVQRLRLKNTAMAWILESNGYKIHFYSKFAILIEKSFDRETKPIDHTDKQAAYMLKEEFGNTELGEMISFVCYQAAESAGVPMPGASPQMAKEWNKYPDLKLHLVEAKDITQSTSYFYDPVLAIHMAEQQRPWSYVDFTFEFTWFAQREQKRLIKHTFIQMS